jgi:hypothetical protein
MCIHFFIHLPLLPTLPAHPPFWKNMFCPLVLWFCWRENIGDNKKDTEFLLVWDKDSYTERFLALFPCTYVLHSTLVHLCQTTSLLLGPLPILRCASLRLLSLLLYRKHISHIWGFCFLSLSYSSCACSPLIVWPMSNNITAFVLDIESTYEGECVIFGLLSLANFA